MKEIIKINFDTQTVSARELHEKLNIGTKFATWFPRMTEYGFTEGIDFTTCYPNLGSENHGGQNMIDYDISVDMAKQICMIQRTPEGKECRQYLIELEKAWNTPEQVMARALKIAQQTVDSLKERCKFLGGQVVEQQKMIEEMQPKASYYDVVLQCKELIPITIIAKDYGMSATKFNSLLHDLRIQFKQSGVWILYTDYQNYGYTKTKTHKYSDLNGVQHSKEHSYWTQKGRLFLYDILKENGFIPLIER